MPPAMRNPQSERPAPRKVSVAKEAGLSEPVKAKLLYREPVMQEAYEATVKILGYEPDFPKSWKE
jgi:hypothetical protein